MENVKPTPLPLGIRMNNPGNMREAFGLTKPAKKENGFVHFDTMDEGVFSLCKLMHSYYFSLGRVTLRSIIQRYAPPTENDTQKYECMVAAYARLNPLRADTADLHFDRAWNVLHFMRAIVWVENGAPPPTWRTQPEWIGLQTWCACLSSISPWKDQL